MMKIKSMTLLNLLSILVFSFFFQSSLGRAITPEENATAKEELTAKENPTSKETKAVSPSAAVELKTEGKGGEVNTSIETQNTSKDSMTKDPLPSEMVPKEAEFKDPRTVRVAYFHKDKKERYDSKVKPAFDQSKTCRFCQMVDLTPYKDNGEVDLNRFVAALKAVENSSYQILFLDWNEKLSEKNREVSEVLTSLSSRGLVVFFSAGSPAPNEPTVSLNKTVAGQIPEALIVGEMTDRERLLPHLFYGPEMLTAVKPPRDATGQGLGPVYFVSRWVSQWSKKKPNEWVAYLKLKKNKNKKLWLDLEDFFPR